MIFLLYLTTNHIHIYISTRSYLEEHGIIDAKQETTRGQLLGYMRDAYASVANPIWEAWGNSYMVYIHLRQQFPSILTSPQFQHEWLVNHGIIKSDYEKKRDALRKMMETYYYDVNDTVWSSWADSELKAWLVDHNIIKPEAQLRKDKLRKLVHDNYASATDTIYSAWRDSEMRDWLINNGYLRSDAQVKRDELLKLFKEK